MKLIRTRLRYGFSPIFSYIISAYFGSNESYSSICASILFKLPESSLIIELYVGDPAFNIGHLLLAEVLGYNLI